MSLFVGNVSKKVTQKQIDDAFKRYGRCQVDLRKRFAFVQYQNERDAEAAMKDLQGQMFCGLDLNIQWSRKSGRYKQNGKDKSRKRTPSRQRSWRKQDRWHRNRSPSYQKRKAPSYSDNEDFESFVPKCPRDQQLLKRIKARRQQGQMIQNHRDNSMKDQ